MIKRKQLFVKSLVTSIILAVILVVVLCTYMNATPEKLRDISVKAAIAVNSSPTASRAIGARVGASPHAMDYREQQFQIRSKLFVVMVINIAALVTSSIVLAYSLKYRDAKEEDE